MLLRIHNFVSERHLPIRANLPLPRSVATNLSPFLPDNHALSGSLSLFANQYP